MIAPLALYRLNDDVGNLGRVHEATDRIQELGQTALRPDGAEPEAAMAFLAACTVGQMDDVRDLRVPGPVQPLAAVQGQGPQRPTVKSPQETEPVAAVSP